MNVAVHIEPTTEAPRAVQYRWDPDTDILSAHVDPGASVEPGLADVRASPLSIVAETLRVVPSAAAANATMELAGDDGSWLILDVAAGNIRGVEVAVWPTVLRRDSLHPPTEVEHARVLVPLSRDPAAAGLEVDTTLVAESDGAERTIHFTLGHARRARTVGIARDILLDVDGHGRLAGLWLLNVPPFPVHS